MRPLTGEARQAALPALAGLRLTVFHDWPYLYEGTRAYEERYIAKFAAAEDAIIVGAFDGDTLVGAATGSPLRGHADEFAAPLIDAGHDPERVFYCGESVLLPAYRGRGIGHAFFDHREGFARTLKRFTHAAFCGVIRPDDHPRKPPEYRPLDAFWHKRGYAKAEGIIGSFAWRDQGDAEESTKPMQFWMKRL